MTTVLHVVLLMLAGHLLSGEPANRHRFDGTLKADTMPEILYFSPQEPDEASPAKPPIAVRVNSNTGRFAVDLEENVRYRVASHPPCAVISDMLLDNERPLSVKTGSAGEEVTELPGVLTMVKFDARLTPKGLELALSVGGKPAAFLPGAWALSKILGPIAGPVAAGGIRLVSKPCGSH